MPGSPGLCCTATRLRAEHRILDSNRSTTGPARQTDQNERSSGQWATPRGMNRLLAAHPMGCELGSDTQQLSTSPLIRTRHCGGGTQLVSASPGIDASLKQRRLGSGARIATFSTGRLEQLGDWMNLSLRRAILFPRGFRQIQPANRRVSVLLPLPLLEKPRKSNCTIVTEPVVTQHGADREFLSDASPDSPDSSQHDGYNFRAASFTPDRATIR
jgi:hypothetical protein